MDLPAGSGCGCYVRLVVVGPTLADLRGEVVRCPDTSPGQLHGAAQPQFTNTVRVRYVKSVKPQTHFKSVDTYNTFLFCVFKANWMFSRLELLVAVEPEYLKFKVKADVYSLSGLFKTAVMCPHSKNI